MNLITESIGEISEQIRTGKTPPTKISEYFEGTYNWYTPGDFSEALLLDSSARFISEKAITENKASIFERNTVLISCIGEIGKIGVLQRKSSCNQQITGITLKPHVDPVYFAYWCKANKDIFKNRARNAVVPILNNALLSSIFVTFPEQLDDQKRIAYLLGKMEGLIAQRKQHLQQLDELLKSVFLEIFGDPVRNEKAWNTLPFHKIGQFVSGGTPSKSRDDFWNGSFPWVSPKDMKVVKIDDATDHISEMVFEETSLKRISSGHLLIVVRGMILAHSFPVAINAVEIAINQDMKAIKPIKGINVVYLQSCLAAQKRQILKLISIAGHGTRKFDAIAMQKLFIPIPPVDKQNQFAIIVEKIESLKFRYQQSLTDLENLYGALSQQAFKGELDLSRAVPPKTDNLSDSEQQPQTHRRNDAKQQKNKTDTAKKSDDFVKLIPFNTNNFEIFLGARKDEVLTATALWQALQQANFENPPSSFESFKSLLMNYLEGRRWLEQVYEEVAESLDGSRIEKRIALRIRHDS